MTTKAIQIAALTLVFSAAAGVCQTTGQPPPKPAENGRSLATAMKFIQDKMNEQGKINFALYTHDNKAGSDWPVYLISIEATNVIADPATCLIRWHKKTTSDGKVGIDRDFSLSLHHVLKLELRSSMQEAKAEDTANGHPEFDKRQDPPYFVVTAQSLDDAGKTVETPLFFTDEDTASRVAKAMTYAVELCGGGSKEPF